MLSKADQLMARILEPFSVDRFFDEIVGQQTLAILGGACDERARLLGSDPRRTILQAYQRCAPTLTSHSVAPKGPAPAARAVSSAAQFHELIRAYHRVNYTVRVPEAGDLSPALGKLTRAMETLMEVPVGVVIFWSDAGATASVHYDEYDVIAIQLHGAKRWFISSDPSELPNRWKRAGEGPPPMPRYRSYDVVPGDLLYLPRGTVHTVASTTESIHLSIGFVPLTVRDALIATLDHLSDLDRTFRVGATRRADDVARGIPPQHLVAVLQHAAEKLRSGCQSTTVVAEALKRRRSRMIADLPGLGGAPHSAAVNVDTVVRHHDLAISDILVTQDVIDFSQPGEHIMVHSGAEQSLRFIAGTPEFAVREIPGEITDDVRVALVQRLLASGFLQLAVPSQPEVAAAQSQAATNEGKMAPRAGLEPAT